MKKLISLLLACSLVLPVAACGVKGNLKSPSQIKVNEEKKERKRIKQEREKQKELEKQKEQQQEQGEEQTVPDEEESQ